MNPLRSSSNQSYLLLRFAFWERVYYKAIEPGYPSQSHKEIGYIVGISEHVGNALCYKVYNPITKKILNRSRCTPIQTDDPNYLPVLPSGEKLAPTIKLRESLQFLKLEDGETETGQPAAESGATGSITSRR